MGYISNCQHLTLFPFACNNVCILHVEKQFTFCRLDKTVTCAPAPFTLACINCFADKCTNSSNMSRTNKKAWTLQINLFPLFQDVEK